jgi:hypothetical protein
MSRWPERTLLERFEEKYVVDGETECWLWTGSINRGGYGHLRADGKNITAHRLSFQLHVGPIPPEHDLDHVCHTNDPSCPGGVTCKHRACVNPAHLEPVTRQENLRRGADRAPWLSCSRGHAFTPENTRIRVRRGRVHQTCLTCERDRRPYNKRAA